MSHSQELYKTLHMHDPSWIYSIRIIILNIIPKIPDQISNTTYKVICDTNLSIEIIRSLGFCFDLTNNIKVIRQRICDLFQKNRRQWCLRKCIFLPTLNKWNLHTNSWRNVRYVNNSIHHEVLEKDDQWFVALNWWPKQMITDLLRAEWFIL